MSKKLNHLEKKLKFHCSVCFTVYQFLEVRTSLRTKQDNKCLNNCLKKWKAHLIEYCQEQIILDLAKKEAQKDEKSQELADWINQISKPNKK